MSSTPPPPPPIPAPHFDLNTYLDLQKSYAIDLTQVSADSNTNTSGTNAINTLKTKLDTVYNSLGTGQTQAQSVLYKQKFINNILDTENARLVAKRDNIDTAINGQRRMIALNNNYQKRYAAYTKIAIAITVGVVLYFFMDKLKVLMPFIPEFIFYLLIIVILGIIFIYIIVVLNDIGRRELTNFDELHIPAPNVPAASPSAISPPSTSNSGGDGSSGGSSQSTTATCSGPQCCIDGQTTYDSVSNKCVAIGSS